MITKLRIMISNQKPCQLLHVTVDILRLLEKIILAIASKLHNYSEYVNLR